MSAKIYYYQATGRANAIRLALAAANIVSLLGLFSLHWRVIQHFVKINAHVQKSLSQNVYTMI